MYTCFKMNESGLYKKIYNVSYMWSEEEQIMVKLIFKKLIFQRHMEVIKNILWFFYIWSL